METLSKRELLKKSQDLTKNTNPASKFYKWESENKTFSYYNKETKENILVELPFRFITLGRPLFCVKGYDEKLSKGIYSNEVRSVKDHLIVKYHDKNMDPIAEGNWNEVKEKAASKGGKYHLSIYGYDLDSKEIINISIKGLGIGEWGNLQKNWSQRLADEVVITKGYKDGKKGAVKFTYPTFELERSINDDELDEVLNSLDILKKYHSEYLKNNGQENDVDETELNDIEVVDEEEIDGSPGVTDEELEELPF